MKINNQQPQVVLIGRTNVGKSTIFNILTEKKKAIVSKIPGTTRDRKYGSCFWLGQEFNLIDTAGLDVSTEKTIDQKSIEFARQAAKKADLILFVVDIKDGLLPQDKEYSKMIKKLKLPYILVINKVDSNKQLNQVPEFLKLGLGEPEIISAATGAGTGDLLDEVIQKLKNKFKPQKIAAKLEKIDIAIIGKPNVGKSSLLNQVTGSEYALVSEIPHTTRDSQEIAIEWQNEEQNFILNFIDTAGIRKKGKIKPGSIEKASVEQSLFNIRKANLVLLVLDANEPITAQDKNITREILEKNKSLIFVVNKWDLVKEKTTKSDKIFIDYLHKSFPYLTWAPIVFISAKTGFKISRLIDLIFEIYNKQNLKIYDKQLERFLKFIVKKQSPRKAKGVKRPFLKKITQIKANPQTFEIIADQPENIHFSYLRFIKNQLREKYKLMGVGVKLITSKDKSLKQRSKPAGKHQGKRINKK